ncbi:hypothetical protein CUC15_15430 [Oceanobacillus zhaokaii]|uniref:Transcriptional regulator n=1 Tax=Oceanobacillus zhaokaii TaxID=2052660 RepID=A0A345PJR0_9BACI|nr:sugar diacid recognition domain-containing protein [Oceanobacillus zhaokaii]AXI10240.1 hypothetical protein CUC15_15430 [Oceanobacillus zhaokaii]
MLTKEIATAIVRETSLRIDRNVNIMDINGVIIATMEPSRMDTIHEGAVEVLRSGRTLKIFQNESERWDGSQPGLNLPIIFREKIIGVIGITGNPEMMGDIGELVKMTTELMISQAFLATQLEWEQRMKEIIIEQLLDNNPQFHEIERGLSRLDFQLNAPFMTAIIQVSDKEIQKQPLIQKIEDSIGEKHVIAGFINLNQLLIALSDLNEEDAISKLESVYTLLKRQNWKFRMVYSLPFHELEQFHQSYLDCDLALRISDPKRDFVSFGQLEVKALVHQLDLDMARRFSHRVLKHFDASKAETLEFFFKSDLNIQKAADTLYLHRNTLIYRLNKITEETGYNPRKFDDALILQIALWIKGTAK